MSIKMQAEYGSDLQVIFVEVQGASDKLAAAFALEKKWLGGGAMWTTERPFDVDLDGIPQFGLLSPEGELVLSGYTMEKTSQIEETIAELVKSAHKPSKDLPKDVAKAVVDARSGSYAKALAALDGILADPEASGDHAAAQAARGEIEISIARAFTRAGWLLDHGYPLEAQALYDSLAKNLKGDAARAEALAGLAQRFASEAGLAELAAGKALDKVEKKVYAEGPSDKAKKSLEKVATSHAGTQVAARAKELAAIVR